MRVILTPGAMLIFSVSFQFLRMMTFVIPLAGAILKTINGNTTELVQQGPVVLWFRERLLEQCEIAEEEFGAAALETTSTHAGTLREPLHLDHTAVFAVFSIVADVSSTAARHSLSAARFEQPLVYITSHGTRYRCLRPRAQR